MGARYKQQVDGDKVAIPAGRVWRIGCCDCKLVHDLKIRKVKGGVEVEVSRNMRATARRRAKK